MSKEYNTSAQRSALLANLLLVQVQGVIITIITKPLTTWKPEPIYTHLTALIGRIGTSISAT